MINMSFLYSIKINISTNDDVNQKLRENNIAAELVVDQKTMAFWVSPRLSKEWRTAPLQEHTNDLEAEYEAWNICISDAMMFFAKHYSAIPLQEKAQWNNIEKLFRCPKMQSYIENQINPNYI